MIHLSRFGLIDQGATAVRDVEGLTDGLSESIRVVDICDVNKPSGVARMNFLSQIPRVRARPRSKYLSWSAIVDVEEGLSIEVSLLLRSFLAKGSLGSISR